MAIDDVKNDIKADPSLGKSMAKWGALGAVVAIPIPFVGPLIGAAAGRRLCLLQGEEAGLMRCPFCGHEDSQVKDSRPTEDGAAIRRRRQCEGCAARFTTFERIQLRDLWVLKSEGAVGENRREPFDREKLMRSVSIATRKRPIDPVRIEKLVSGIQRQLETQGDPEVAAKTIGEMVMDGLKGLDSVAYIRFASVYKDFTEARDFEEFAGNVSEAAKG